MLNHDKLICLATRREIEDDGLVLEDETSPQPSLLRAIYRNTAFAVSGDAGIFRYPWLPVNRVLKAGSAPVSYQSRRLADELGLNALFVTFSGWWPEIGATMATGTFKECEAYAVCARLPEGTGRVLVVASAGNTARAFLRVASDNRIPAVIVVPEKNVGSLWSIEALDPCVKVIAAGGGADYAEAIRLAGALCKNPRFVNEGGAKNVARRDGMGTTVLSAAEAMGGIPDWYFQAVGSGTGAIAAREANLRLNACGRFPQKTMGIVAAQNLPFAPMMQAWEKRSRIIEPMGEAEAASLIDRIDAKVLSNRQPPWGIVGGLYDALEESGGSMDAVMNAELRAAQAMFLELEGRDICPEAGVALASLIRKVRDKTVRPGEAVMLNVTGGGMEALKRERRLHWAKPDLIVGPDFDPGKIGNKVLELF